MTQQQHLAAQESNERNGKDEIVITAIEVTSPQARLDFLFSKIRSLCNIFENSVFNYMRQHANAYQGGFWDFYNLSNGGGYMQPPKGYLLTTPNGVMEDVSAQEAGIIVTLMMLSHFSFVTHEKDLMSIASVSLTIFTNYASLFLRYPLNPNPRYLERLINHTAAQVSGLRVI